MNSFFNSLQRVPSSSFHFSLYRFKKPSIVFETASTCSFLDLPFPLHKFWVATINFLKNYQRVFASDLYNKQKAQTNHFQIMQKTRCWRYIKVVSRSSYPTQAWLPSVTLSSVKGAFFMLFDFAVSISCKTTYISR